MEEVSYPTVSAIDAIMTTCEKHAGEKFAMTPESLEIEIPDDFDTAISTDEVLTEFMLDHLEKKKDSLQTEDIDAEKEYVEAVRDYAYKAVMEMFPGGFYEELTDTFLQDLVDKCYRYDWEY